MTQLCLLPHDIFYFAPVGSSILLVWGNVCPHLSLFFGSMLHILAYVLLLFSVFCTMQLTIQASGMNKFKVYVNYVCYHHFMVSIIKIGIIWSAFSILIHVYYFLQVLWSFC